MTIFFFTPTRRLIFCFITVIVSLAVHDGAFAARKFTSVRGVGNVASTATAQAPVAAGDSSPPLHPPLSPVSAPSDEADEVTAVTPKTPDQSNDETPAPASATDAAAKTAAPSWRPRSPSPSSALSPSPLRKRRKTDGEEAQSEVPAAETAPPASRKRRHSVTGSGTDGGRMTAAQRLGIRVRRGRGRVLRRVGRRGRMDS